MNNMVPIFKSIFGKQWAILPPVMLEHYANRPYCDDVGTVEGKMDVTFGLGEVAVAFFEVIRCVGALSRA